MFEVKNVLPSKKHVLLVETSVCNGFTQMNFHNVSFAFRPLHFVRNDFHVGVDCVQDRGRNVFVLVPKDGRHARPVTQRLVQVFVRRRFFGWKKKLMQMHPGFHQTNA